MYQIVHGSAGLLIGSQTGNPWLAFILGFLSHFILDAIPHDSLEIKNWQDRGNYIKKIASEAIIDLLLFLGLFFLLWQNNLVEPTWAMGAGILGALLPDYIWGLGEFFKIENKWLEKFKHLHNLDHTLLHKNIYIPLKYGLPIQLFFVVIFIVLFLVL